MEKLQRFQVLESYAESVKALYAWDKALAGEISYRIIQYGIYGTPPPKNSHPVVLALFNQIKIPIDNCRAKSWNAKKNWEKVLNQNQIKSKSNENQTATESKSNDNQTVWKSKNIKSKNIDNTNITILSDSKATPVVYGDSNINECMEIIKGFNGWIINGAEKKQRIYAKNLIAKLQKLELVTARGYTRQEVLKALVVVKNNPYHSAKLGSPELIYYNLASLLQVCEDEFTGGKSSKTKLNVI